jgi:NDP-sugar pyrophosphorylase family protein
MPMVWYPISMLEKAGFEGVCFGCEYCDAGMEN